MSKHYQESEIEFKREEPDMPSYPVARGLVVYSYGGTLEECIKNARGVFKLDASWKVINAEMPKH